MARLPVGLVLVAGMLSGVRATAQQPAFAVATIRLSAGPVPFEHDGKTEISPAMLRMRDVTVNTCLKWAYGIQDSQISGPDWLRSEHLDIVAKSDGPVGGDQMKLMMQALLADRFKLSFHRQERELKAFALTVAKGGAKLHEAASEEKPSMQNSAVGTVAKATTMQQLANLLAGPLQSPVTDETGLNGKYDFAIDFTNYLPEDMKTMRPDATSVLLTALQGEIGLKLESRKVVVEVLVVDHVEKPSEN
ncbi:MAG TPA: TIGR03435 family protein [Acidobacteriaceae bacterium]